MNKCTFVHVDLSGEGFMRTSEAIHPESAEILAALPRHDARGPGLYVGRQVTGQGGALQVLETGPDGDDLVSLADPLGDGEWYLGCIECTDEIEWQDGGVCDACRQDLAYRHEQDRLAHEPPLPWGPDSLDEL
jgi:hypothetical protein